MNESMVIDLARKTVWTILLAASPMMIAGLVVGLLVSVFQAATQINEQTMTFAPKIVAVLVALIVAGPWIMDLVIEFTIEIFGALIVSTGKG